MKRTKSITVHLTEEEEARIKAHAKDVGVGKSAFIRIAALKLMKEMENDPHTN